MDCQKMPFLLREVALGISLVLLTSVHSEEFHGRHVCNQQKTVTQTLPVQQTYRRAVYKKDLQRVTYQTAYRTVFRMQIHAEVAPGCCPGWQKRSPRDLSCAKPVCSEPCEHGGQCVGPDLCLCTDGYTGYRCHLDIDECTGRNSCQQKCANVHGSYQCTCQAGFRLADDKYTCDLCLNCTQEFQDLQEKLQTLESSSRQDETLADMKRQLENLTDTRQQEYKLEHIQQQLEVLNNLVLYNGRFENLQEQVRTLQTRLKELDTLPDLHSQLDNMQNMLEQKEILTARFLKSYSQIENEFKTVLAMKAQVASFKELEKTVKQLQDDTKNNQWAQLQQQVDQLVANTSHTEQAQANKMVDISRELGELREVKVQMDTVKKQLERMSGRVEDLEAEKAELKSSLQTAVSQYEAARRDLEAAGANTEPSPTPDPYELDPHKMPLDRLASLSEQISILEERMADCACSQDYPRG